MKQKKFALIGVAGYVAKKHLESIKSINGDLIACCDINDSVGILDSYFPETSFFNEISRFDRFIQKVSKTDKAIDYFVICTPNHIHDYHIKFGLKNNLNVICEKPIVTNPELLKELFNLEKNSNKKIFTILQLRNNEKIGLIKKIIKNKTYLKCNLEYVTPRGGWYDYSWKGNDLYSGGILFNIGSHLFDFLIYIFGKYKDFHINKVNNRNISGIIYFKKAEVKWSLSLDQYNGTMMSKREIIIDNHKYDLAKTFQNNHLSCYKSILKNDKNFLARNSVDAINLINEMRKSLDE